MIFKVSILSNYFRVNDVELVHSIKSCCTGLYVNIPDTAILKCLLKKQLLVITRPKV